MNFVFGPVPSRRLGRSLGIDLVPFKTCSYDCLYCQLGRTTNKTIERRPWVNLDDVLRELKDKLRSCEPDYITLSGSGEPTLFSELDSLIDGIGEITNIPIAVLTNGSLLYQPAVRNALIKADLVIPSLDAGDETMFQAVNRPEGSLTFEKMLSGLIDFRKEFSGKYWLEVLIMAGYTAISAEVRKIADCVKLIKPDKVQLNTVTRPPAEEYAKSVTHEQLQKFIPYFDVPTEIIADFRNIHKEADFQLSRQTVLEMLKRRPCTIDDIAGGLNIHKNEAVKYIEELLTEKLIEKISVSGKIYYSHPTNKQ